MNQKLVLSGIICFWGISLFFTGCSLDVPDDSRVVKGEGPIVAREYFLDSIESVIHIGVGETRITRGPVQKVIVRAQQNVLDLISAEVSEHTMGWGFTEKISLDPETDSIIVEIQITHALKKIRLAGIGNVNISGPKQDNLKIELSGGGNINSYNMPLGNCEIDFPGFGDCYVMAADTISGLLSGQGTIYYKGDPVILMAITGNGNVFKDEQ